MKSVHHCYFTKTQGSLLNDQTESPMKMEITVLKYLLSARYLVCNRANIIE